MFNNINKNIIYLFLSEFISRFINFLALIIVMRKLSIDEFGEINFTLSVISFFLLFSNFGLDVYGIRETSKRQSNSGGLISDIISLKIILSILFFTIYLFYTFFLVKGQDKLLMSLYSFIIILSPANIYWYYQGKDKIRHIFVARIIESILYLLLVYLFLSISTNKLYIPLAVVICQITSYAYYYIKYENKFRFSYKFESLKMIFNETKYIGLSTFLILIYYNFDIILLGYLKSNEVVGVYSAAVKIFLMCVIPLNLILSAFFPELSKMFKGNSETWKPVYFRFVKIMMVLSFTISLFVYLFADILISIVYGNKYLASVYPLKIYSLTIFFVGINILLGNPLIAWGLQKIYIVVIFFGAFMSILLNVLLIPEYSYIGSAYATLLSEFVVLIGFINLYIFKRKLIPLF